MLELLKPAAFVLGSWVGLFFIFGGIGLLAMRLMRASRVPRLFPGFWLGWALTLALLQVWHLFFAVNWLALTLVWLLGMAGLFLHWRSLWEMLKTEWRQRKVFWLVAGLAVLWLANLATGAVSSYDAGLYQTQTLKWAESYPIVPGLGNIHGRLAYNSSYYLYVALLDAGEWAGRAHHLAGGLLAVVLLVHSLRSLSAVFAARGLDRAAPLFYALLFAPILIEVSGGAISGLGTNLPVFILSVLLLGELLRWLLHSRQMEPEERRLSLFWMAAMVCAGIAVKASFAALGITALGIALAVQLAKRGENPRRERWIALGLIAAPALLILVPWMARGVILSGYPFYPSVFAGFNVPWRVPRSLAISEANWSRSWARSSGPYWAEVLGNWNWLESWSRELPQDVLRALSVAGIAGLLALLSPRVAAVRERGRALLWIFLLPAVVSLVFWFSGSPNADAAMGEFWALAAGAAALAVVRLLPADTTPAPPSPGPFRAELRYDTGPKPQPLLVLILAAFFLFLSPLRSPLIVAPGADAGFHAIGSTASQGRVTDEGFVVYMPKEGDRCGNAPLPCTPYFRPNLRSVVAFGSRYGFQLDDTVTYLDMHGAVAAPNPALPAGLSVLFQTGWLNADPGTTARWTTTPSRMMVYAEEAQTVRMSLTPFKMHVRGVFGDYGQLRVLLNGKVVGTYTVRSGVATDVTLRLRRDFNFVTLQFLGGNFVPNDSPASGSTDTRTLAIGFHKVLIFSAE